VGPPRLKDVITARPATPEEAEVLQLAAGVPVLCATRMSIATAGAAKDTSSTSTPPDAMPSRVEIRYPITRATTVPTKV
jgi:GntR family transcriptional regulator